MNFVAFEFMIYIERVVRDFILPDNILVVKNRTYYFKHVTFDHCL